MILVNSKPFLALISHHFLLLLVINSLPCPTAVPGWQARFHLRVFTAAVPSAWKALYPQFYVVPALISFMSLTKWHLTTEISPHYLFESVTPFLIAYVKLIFCLFIVRM